MKKLVNIFGLLFALPLLLAVLFPAQPASAAPVCYQLLQERTVGKACSEFSGLNIEGLLGHGLRDGFCYGFHEFGVTEAAINSGDCKKWELEAVGSGFADPLCYRYGGSSAELYSGSFDSTKLDTVECSAVDAELKDQFGSSFTPSNGMCYVVVSGGTVTTPECAVLKRNVDASVDRAANNTDREAVVECNGTADGVAEGEGPQGCFETNPIVELILRFINFFSAGVGVVVTIIIIIGGMQYMTAGANPQAVAAAKKRLINAILALAAYMLLFAFLQWVVPGGIF